MLDWRIGSEDEIDGAANRVREDEKDKTIRCRQCSVVLGVFCAGFAAESLSAAE